MMFARPQIPGSASPLSLCLKLMPTKCFSSLWVKFMPALFGPCQAA
jgi:hypothetical protein